MNEHYPFENPPLPYAYDALEPYIDTKTMELHHSRHLQAYVDNLNNALKDCPALHKCSLEWLICHLEQLPCHIQKSIRDNSGGVYNHIFYFCGMTGCAAQGPVGALRTAIDRDFCSCEHLKEALKKQAMSVFGSGWAWLTTNQNGRLCMITTPNQDTPIARNLCPILGIDVWEHAYYLKHYNKRGDYIDDWFHVVDWEQADQLYRSAIL